MISKTQNSINMNASDLTLVEKRGDHWYKRDDLFVVNGACGGKARVINEIVTREKAFGVTNFVTCGGRDSRQSEILAKVCELHGVSSHIFMPSGKDTDISVSIENTKYATIHRTKVGYNTVLNSESKRFAAEQGMFYFPFGMHMGDTIVINSQQVENVPMDVKRIIIPCGGGMNMIAVIKGLEMIGRRDVEVIGVVVGANPTRTFKKWLPETLFDKCNIKYSFVKSDLEYGRPSKVTEIDGIELDEIYEARCIPFLKDGDMLWIVGKKIN